MRPAPPCRCRGLARVVSLPVDRAATAQPSLPSLPGGTAAARPPPRHDNPLLPACLRQAPVTRCSHEAHLRHQEGHGAAAHDGPGGGQAEHARRRVGAGAAMGVWRATPLAAVCMTRAVLATAVFSLMYAPALHQPNQPPAWMRRSASWMSSWRSTSRRSRPHGGRHKRRPSGARWW